MNFNQWDCRKSPDHGGTDRSCPPIDLLLVTELARAMAAGYDFLFKYIIVGDSGE